MTLAPIFWQPGSEFQLTPVAQDIWLARHPLSFYGFPMVTCMTVVRLGNGDLWVHSPIPLSKPLLRNLEALGPVRHIVAPNRLHHLYAQACLASHPQATLYVAPGLPDKNPALAEFPLIPAPEAAPWHADIDQIFVAGNTELNETVFFHQPSSSLIMTDLAVYLGPWDALPTRLYARLNGCYNRFGHSFMLRHFFKDRQASRAAVEHMLNWDFERIIPAHGPRIETDARHHFLKAFAWLLQA